MRTCVLSKWAISGSMEKGHFISELLSGLTHWVASTCWVRLWVYRLMLEVLPLA